MADGGGGGDGTGFSHPPNGGEFLLSLLQKQQHQRQTQQPHLQPQSTPLDPAVALVGPTIPINGQYLHHQQQQFLPGWSHSSPPPPNFFPHNMFQANRNIDLFNSNDAYVHNSSDNTLTFGSFPAPISDLDASFNGNLGSVSRSSIRNSSSGGGGGGLGVWDKDFVGLARYYELDRSKVDNFISGRGKHVQTQNGIQRGLRGSQNLPPGFPSKLRGGKGESWDSGDFRRMGVERNVHNVTEIRNMKGGLNNGIETVRRGQQQHEGTSRAGGSFGLTGQLDHPGPPAGSKLKSASASDIDQSRLSFHLRSDVHEIDSETVKVEKVPKDSGYQSDHELDELSEQLIGSLGLSNGVDESEVHKNHHKSRDKDVRSDTRGQQILNQRMRFKLLMACRNDINRIHYLNDLNAHFLEIYMSLIPANEEKARQKKLLALLEKLVSKEWPQAQLYIYGSCANSFGVSRSDIDICLSIDDAGISKSDILLKLADILESDNLQKVQALTRARVPIVKLMDPETGLFADICINNVLAVVNTKLLRDYAKIDVRLRQLAFIVKHWAKSRGVNETYHGTLSSYAYVLMCIHFLQQRKPPILPCLQGMTATYSVTVDSVECAFFDRVDELGEFGACNKESISQLVWGFFCYWAYSHDYANCVISVRTGRILSKQEKDWTRRIGNDRHLICIEDPFETSHDLGRVVDKNSIRVLREEFERAANVMQHDPNPHVTLFEPYVPTL